MLQGLYIPQSSFYKLIGGGTYYCKFTLKASKHPINWSAGEEILVKNSGLWDWNEPVVLVVDIAEQPIVHVMIAWRRDNFCGTFNCSRYLGYCLIV